ncbi:MAG: glycosyltransferase [Bacteroidales bacterium]|nr:glycosyltransferase [Bacteroidales bacterium]
MEDINPIVRVCCITYNHVNYIREAIEGFLMQKIDFPIEIIIHDDASTDNTTQIIDKYAKKNLIKYFQFFKQKINLLKWREVFFQYLFFQKLKANT